MAALVDTNILVYAHDRDAGDKHARALDLLARLSRSQELAISAQILNELGPGMSAGLSFWDSLVWATAHANKIGVVYTEDFAHDRVVEGVRFIDPFRST